MSSALLTGEQKHQANFLLGPWLIGSCLDLILQGVLSCQFINYFTWYSDDKRMVRIIVAILALLTILKSIQAFAIIWIQFIVFFGDLEGAILLNYTTWWQSGNPLMVAMIGLYVQTYFCYRLWVISKKWYVAAPVAALFLFAFLAIVVAFISTTNELAIGNWFAVHLSSVFAGDVILSLTTAYFLLKSKKDVLPQPPLHFGAAMFNLIFSQVYPGGVAIISTAFNMALPKLYAISMLWTLNARRVIRAAHSSHNGMSNASNELSGARARARRPNGDMELGAIQVITQIDTRIDVRDMFDPTGDSKHASTHGQVRFFAKKSEPRT
ncbi:hypothetical protein B0H11DRAFT_2242874 [Mycena galericulata]|nr:hypothetical protein B0H11DRAFT_2242874 [Mycena galericulata]